MTGFFRYWALAVPAYATVAIVLALSFYVGLNFMSTPPSASLNTMFGKLPADLLLGLPMYCELYHVSMGWVKFVVTQTISSVNESEFTNLDSFVIFSKG